MFTKIPSISRAKNRKPRPPGWVCDHSAKRFRGGYCPTTAAASIVIYSARQNTWPTAMSKAKNAAVATRCWGS